MKMLRSVELEEEMAKIALTTRSRILADRVDGHPFRPGLPRSRPGSRSPADLPPNDAVLATATFYATFASIFEFSGMKFFLDSAASFAGLGPQPLRGVAATLR